MCLFDSIVTKAVITPNWIFSNYLWAKIGVRRKIAACQMNPFFNYLYLNLASPLCQFILSCQPSILQITSTHAVHTRTNDKIWCGHMHSSPSSAPLSLPIILELQYRTLKHPKNAYITTIYQMSLIAVSLSRITYPYGALVVAAAFKLVPNLPFAILPLFVCVCHS